MQSLILTFFSRLLAKLAYWFDESICGCAFNRLAAFLAVAFRQSFFGRLFAEGAWGGYFRESFFYRLLTFPVRLCRRIAGRTAGFFEALAHTSGIFWLFSNWHNISIRIYGLVLGSFSLFYELLRLLTNPLSLWELCFLAALFILSLLAVFINRSIRSLFKGSRILTAIGGLFCYIKMDSDSRLFFEEPDFLLTRPVFCVGIGLACALAALFMPLSAFLLAAAGFLYVCLALRYVTFGVFCIILAAPILPTMALAACSCLTVISFFLHLALCREYPLRPVPLAGYIAVFALTLALGALNSFTFIKSLQILFIHLAFILFYFVAFQTLDTKKKWRAALTAFLLTSGLVALYGIYQNFAGISSTASWVDQNMFEKIKVRVYSTFDNPNVLGEYLVMMIPIALAVIWKSKTNGQKTLYAALLLALGTCMIFTWSRGAWLGVMLAAAAFLLVMDKRWFLPAVLGVLMLPMLLASGSAIADRILSIGNTADTSTAYRVSIWRASAVMIRDFWLSGIGLGSEAFSMIYPKYALAGANFALHSHNLFLQLWVETGIAGILAFLCMIAAFMRQSFALNVYRERSRMSASVSMALAAGVLGFLLQGLTDNVWYNYKMVLLFWIMLALAGSASAPDFNHSDSVRGGDRI